MKDMPEPDYQYLDFKASRPDWAQIRAELIRHVGVYVATVGVFALLVYLRG